MVGRSLQLVCPFPRSYEVTELERILGRAGEQRVVAFPGGLPVDPQQELADAPIVQVAPREGDPWIGIFYGGILGGGPPQFPAELVSWPDGVSFCVVYRGLGVRVHADDPDAHETIQAEPITGVRAVPEAGLVLFADFTSLTCYDRSGLVWRSERLVWDELRIESIDVDRGLIELCGFDAPAKDRNAVFTVDLASGSSTNSPYRGR